MTIKRLRSWRSGAVAGVPSRRAQVGDNLTLYGIGFGSVAPNSPAGQIVAGVNSLTLPCR